MKNFMHLLFGAMVMTVFSHDATAEKLTIATVNNGDIIRMQELSGEFTQKYPDIELEWVVLEENVLRQRVTEDVQAKSAQYDIVSIGTYEVPIWGKQGWLVSLNDLPSSYDTDDILPAIRKSISVDGTLFAAPFYGESSMVMYRTDLMEKVGLKMPQAPTWDFIYKAASAITDKKNDIYGICLRGKAGWGENMAFLSAMGNSFGARWFNMDWSPQFNTAPWKKTLSFYLDLMTQFGPPNASSYGFNENLALFQDGKCAIWVDATVAASFLTNPKESGVYDKVGFALAPDAGLGKRANWLWAWNLAIPAGTKSVDAAKKFIAWATSKEYLELVASKEGWQNVPPGTRKSLYENPQYADIPFAHMTLESINAAKPNMPTVEPVPYVGIQYVSIPEFPVIATTAAHQFSAALAGNISADTALQNTQFRIERAMKKAKYLE